MDLRRPHVTFLDRASAHPLCHERAETARLLAAAERALWTPDALADEAEVILDGEAPP